MQSIYDIVTSSWTDSYSGWVILVPKIMLFGELKKKKAAHEPKKRLKNLQQLRLVDSWYHLYQHGGEWYKQCQEKVNKTASHRGNRCVANMHSEEGASLCERTFHRMGGLTRHSSSFCNS